MTNMKLNIWGREFDLPVEFDLYEGEVVSNVQKKLFLDLKRKISVMAKL